MEKQLLESGESRVVPNPGQNKQLSVYRSTLLNFLLFNETTPLSEQGTHSECMHATNLTVTLPHTVSNSCMNLSCIPPVFSVWSNFWLALHYSTANLTKAVVGNSHRQIIFQLLVPVSNKGCIYFYNPKLAFELMVPGSTSLWATHSITHTHQRQQWNTRAQVTSGILDNHGANV